MKSFYAQKWLDTAKRAASGGNAQPWAVEFDEKPSSVAIRLSIDPAYIAHPSAMDKGGEASAMALGSLAFNLEIVANLDHYELSHKLWDLQKTFWDSSVTLFFTANADVKSEFSLNDIIQRKTDRTPYQKTEIPGQVLKNIRLIVRKYDVLEYFEFNTNKEQIAPALLEIEKIRWSNSELINSFLSEISFGKEEQVAKDKIPASQLGIPFLLSLFLRTLRSFPQLNVVFKLGFLHVASKKALENYIKRSDRLFFIQAINNDFECCYELGKCFQEIWLSCNQAGLGFQPFGLPLIPLTFWNHNGALKFTAAEPKKLEAVTSELANKFQMNLKCPMMGLRIGIPTQDAKQTLRKEITGKHNSELTKPEYTKPTQMKIFGM